MEVLLSRYQSLVLDHIQSGSSIPFSFLDPKLFGQRPLFFGYSLSFSRKRWRNPFTWIHCSFAMEQGLKPCPKLKTSNIDIAERKETPLEETQIKKPHVGICSQIEKLVLCKRYRESVELFEILELEACYEVDNSTYNALVSACIGMKSIRDVKRVFNRIISHGFEPDQYMSNRILLMHVICGMMIDARILFDRMQEKNLVSWSKIVTGIVDSGDYIEAFRRFLVMWQDFSDCGSHTFAIMIQAFAGLGFIFSGQQFHSCAVKMSVNEDIFVSCALIDMYSKCGCIEDAQFVFDGMSEKTTVGWNSIIVG